MKKFLKFLCIFALLFCTTQVFGQSYDGDTSKDDAQDTQEELYYEVEIIRDIEGNIIGFEFHYYEELPEVVCEGEYPWNDVDNEKDDEVNSEDFNNDNDNGEEIDNGDSGNGDSDDGGDWWDMYDDFDWEGELLDGFDNDFWEDLWSDFENDQEKPGGGGTGNTGNGGNPTYHGGAVQLHTTNPTDRFARPLPHFGTTELKYRKGIGHNNCVSMSMAFAYNCFGGNKTEAYFANSFSAEYNGKDIYQEGAKSDTETPAFINKHFVVSPSANFGNSITAAINAHALVFVGYPTAKEKISHFVVVVGYTQTGNYIFLDPDHGVLFTAIPSFFENELCKLYYVTGIK